MEIDKSNRDGGTQRIGLGHWFKPLASFVNPSLPLKNRRLRAYGVGITSLARACTFRKLATNSSNLPTPRSVVMLNFQMFMGTTECHEALLNTMI